MSDGYNRTYLGIDQSLNSTGMCVIDAIVGPGNEIEFDSLHTIALMEIVRQKSDSSELVKAKKIVGAVLKNINFYQVDVVGIEGLAFGAKGKAKSALDGLSFLLRYMIKYNDLEFDPIVRIITPGALKKFATGNGNAPKGAMIEALPSIAMEQVDKIKPASSQNDAADAYWLARAAAMRDCGILV